MILVAVNLPMAAGTFDTANWSDDYQHTNLIVTKAKLSGLFPMIFEAWGGDNVGGHFAPVFALVNTLIGLISLDPRFFHLIIVFLYMLTAFFIYRLIEECNGDRPLGLVAAVLFSLNYYIGFFGLTWNTMNVHVTNAFLGTVSVFFMVRYLKTGAVKYLVGCGAFLLSAVWDIENGLVFFPILSLLLFFKWRKKELDFAKASKIFLILCLVVSAYPAGAYLASGKLNPLGHRFHRERTVQGYAFVAHQLLIRSTGLTIFYDKMVYDPLKNMPDLKESMKKFLRQNDRQTLNELPVKYLFILLAVGVLSLAFAAVAVVLLLRRTRPELKFFLWGFALLYLLFVFVYNRIDVVNAVSIFSSVLIAELILSFWRETRSERRWIGTAIAGLILVAAVWTVGEGFDDCYRLHYFGLSKVAIQGPDIIYREMNRKIGRFARDGVILFTHDYSAYHQTTGRERIGDMLSVQDFGCYNASVFYRDFLRSDLVEKYKRRKFNDLYFEQFVYNPAYRQVVIASKEEALRYILDQRVDLAKIPVIYLSQDYNVHLLNEEINLGRVRNPIN